jgi:hypothetical protein
VVLDSAGVSGSQDDWIVVPIVRTLADYRDGYSWYRWHSGFVPATIVIAVVWGIFRFHNSPVGLVTFFVITAVGLAIYYALSLSVIAARMMKAHAANGASSYTFSSNGYEYRSDVSESSTLWSGVRKVVETRRSYLLFVAGSRFVIIPKACVPADKAAQLRGLFERSLPRRVKLRAGG